MIPLLLLLLLLCASVASKIAIAEAAHNECAVEKFNREFEHDLVLLTNLPVIGDQHTLLKVFSSKVFFFVF